MKQTNDLESLKNLINKAAHLVGQRVILGRLDEINDLDENTAPTTRFIAAWQKAGLDGKPSILSSPTPADLPFVVFHPEFGWLLVHKRRANGTWQAETPQGDTQELPSLSGFFCIDLPERSTSIDAPMGPPRAFIQTARALLKRWPVFAEAILATVLINLLALATSFYAMQIFDRVIPNQGFQTLIVLTVGVGLSVLLEFVLKQVRSHMVDRTATIIDQEMSSWFFQRMLAIRMEARPATVGTLASQIKGFEMVRSVLASTPIFILADIPFSFLFVAVIALVGGWVALVPLIALPIVLLIGVSFQYRIQRHTRDTVAHGNRKTGLLVEAVEGAESLKACNAEWRMQGRWNSLVKLATQADDRIRANNALAQNVTVALQQLSYVAIIAVGAWRVAENDLTLGGLLACSIIANRAMLPIVQLPTVMVQWAHAQAALEGLDKILALPSEADDAHHTIAPQALQSALRFERVRFVYGHGRRTAIDIDRLEVSPGERVGLIGPIGSGKSTLLKLASGLYRPNEGKVFLSGIDMTLLAPVVVRETVGYLPQEPRLFSGSLRENLLLGLPDPGDEIILDVSRRTGLIDLINSHPKGLNLEISEGGRGVSGGQKQLIALTRLLLAKPKIWLLDEPTGSMDADNEARLVALFKEIWGPQESAIVTTHKTALLPLFTRLVVVQGGRIILDGHRDEVMAKLTAPRICAKPKEAKT